MSLRTYVSIAALCIVPFTAALAKWGYDPGGHGVGQSDYSAPPGANSDTAMKTLNEAQQALKDTKQESANADTLSKAAGINPHIPTSPGDAVAMYKEMQALYNAFESYQALAKQDKQQEPQLDANSGPGLPVHCQTLDAQALAAEDQRKKDLVSGKTTPAANPDAGQCLPCYTAAETKINARRVAFERLRILLVYTKTMATQGEGFLNAAGSAGGSLAALEAQAQIRKVDASLAGFYDAYDKKYDELLASFKSSLDEFEVCETKYFNNPDWYNRYGFLYYQFIADKYKRQ